MAIYQERVKLETSNLAGILTTRKKAKLGQSGREGVTWPAFEILGPSPYLRNR